MKVKQLLKQTFPLLRSIKGSINIRRRYRQERLTFRKNWIRSRTDIKTAGYDIIINAHALEKGMTSKQPRPFGITRTDEIINLMTLYEQQQWSKDYAYNLGASILSEYCRFYKKYKWEKRTEYKKVSAFIKNRHTTLKSGTLEIHRTDFMKAAQVNYRQFLSTKHSIRAFEPHPLSNKDIVEAVTAATKTPTACNRQMIKIYYIKNNSIKQQVMKYAHGLTGFDKETANIFIITHDISSLCDAGEISQGYFNAGLVTMNFVNSLHSEGIGSCMLAFNNNISEERHLKKLLNIPQCERISVMIAAGYYPEKSLVPRSTRKTAEEIYEEII